MRREWDRRARRDPYYYAGFGKKNQEPGEFLASAADTVEKLTAELPRLPENTSNFRRALEIGCGPARLMLSLSTHFEEIHGVDVSEEMANLARKHLAGVPHAHVHVASGSDLAPFPDAFFDFVYSYAVFQHIPERDVILNYVREARRTLKTGGVLCCQFRGAPPLASEMDRESSTWTGTHFNAEELLAFSREQNFHLVRLEGMETQYLWTTWLKPTPEASGDFSRFHLKAVTATSGGENRVPARGRDAAVSLWVEGLPGCCHLGNLQVRFNDTGVCGAYLSPIDAGGGCQIDARLPAGLTPGRYAVRLCHEGVELGEPCAVEITPPPPRQPRIVAVTDGISIASRNRIETGALKLTIEDIADPQGVRVTVAGSEPHFVQWERKDPVTDTYEFAYHLSPKTPRGVHPLRITVSGQELPLEQVEVVTGRRWFSPSAILRR